MGTLESRNIQPEALISPSELVKDIVGVIDALEVGVEIQLNISREFPGQYDFQQEILIAEQVWDFLDAVEGKLLGLEGFQNQWGVIVTMYDISVPIAEMSSSPKVFPVEAIPIKNSLIFKKVGDMPGQYFHRTSVFKLNK